MQDTHNVDVIASAVLDLLGMLNSPQRDDVLLGEAGVSIDRALFPLLVRLGNGRASVAELADKVGRDYTTVSRQLAKLEELNLIERADGEGDRRRREAIFIGRWQEDGPRHLGRAPPATFKGVRTVERKRQGGAGEIYAPICG